ncbi:TonB family protein [Mariprofundus ferrooxydans]|uniref:TonB family protein n=1 Tax=Mariprofundus ferrooxydans TaxID=314344 RepID=UPI0006A6F3EA|nr:TonB family protein [Mariprofundus ferrooxydans]KON48000.1 hypothetical protein AL013_04400 [Mariprofundus ferrooxydans]
MMAGDGWLRPAAVTISLALHTFALWQFGGSASASHVMQPDRQVSVTQLNLIAPTAKPNDVESVSDTEPLPEPKQLPKKEPVQPKPKPVKQEAVAEKALPPKPESKPKARQERPKKNRKTPSKTQHQQAAQQSQSAPPAIDKGLIAEARQHYLAMVMAHIEAHKFYPPTARRRGIQGDVRISFLLLADGTTKQIRTNGSSRILQTAAKTAVIKAIPMPKPPSVIHCPMHCEFAMRYVLD